MTGELLQGSGPRPSKLEGDGAAQMISLSQKPRRKGQPWPNRPKRTARCANHGERAGSIGGRGRQDAPHVIDRSPEQFPAGHRIARSAEMRRIQRPLMSGVSVRSSRSCAAHTVSGGGISLRRGRRGRWARPGYDRRVLPEARAITDALGLAAGHNEPRAPCGRRGRPARCRRLAGGRLRASMSWSSVAAGQPNGGCRAAYRRTGTWSARPRSGRAPRRTARWPGRHRVEGSRDLVSDASPAEAAPRSAAARG